ncbi:MAG: heat-inducible transcriptional repressor HrcA [Ruminococcus sp.]
MELAQRKQKILSAVVESYIRTGEPVGSKTLIDETDLGVSSATVRNDMADLTQKGYLIQPHTSAGRIPTQQGYRYYVDNLMQVVAVSQHGAELVEDRLYRNAESPENILNSASQLVCELTGLTAAVTTPNSAESRIHRISFVQTGSHTAMAVVIASNGIIKNQLFRCEFIITPQILEVFDKALNELFDGVKLSSINRPFIQTAAARFGELSLFMPSVLTAIKDAADKANEIGIFLSGQTKPLFMQDVNFPAARNVIELLSKKSELANVLTSLPIGTAVSIGTENSRVELAYSSVISSSYSVKDTPSGTLAVIAPMRTDYGRAISIIECVSECVSRIISELIEH